jgi:superfamily II RNA helicase
MGQRDGRYLSLPLIGRLLSADGLLQPFDQLTTLTDVAEGTIVRVITRLDETCREVRDAARVIGDAALMKKMEEAQMKIKRDSECLTFC